MYRYIAISHKSILVSSGKKVTQGVKAPGPLIYYRFGHGVKF